jgi:hypothetical protein
MLLREVTETPNAQINTLIVPMKTEDLEIDKFASINSIFGNLIILMYVVPVFMTTFLIVKEKEQKIKESMRMMGMSDLPYWLSWFFYYSGINLMTSVFATVTLAINVFPLSNYFLIFLVIFLYGQSLFG